MQNIGATKIVYVGPPSAPTLTTQGEIKLIRKDAADKESAKSGSRIDFQKAEVMQSQECMFILYNIIYN